MKKLFCIGLICAMLLAFAPAALAQEEPLLAAQSAILADMDTGAVLYERNADERCAPASLTKIMTVLLAVEAIEAGEATRVEYLTADADFRAGLTSESSSAGIQAGERLRMEELLYCAMLQSANESCNMLAVRLAGSVEAFAERMNERAAELGCTGTHFTNPNGLFDEDHYTTARDLANITRTAMKNKTFRRMVAAKEWNADRPGSTYRHFVNKNKTVRQFDGGNGVKIGYTKASGRTLAASATRDGKNVICVVMSAPNWFQDAYRLMEYGFDVL